MMDIRLQDLTVEDVIKHYIRQNAKTISDLKQAASVHVGECINPKHKQWKTYVGYKREASKWLIALHTHRGNNDKRSCHISDKYPYLIAYANKSLFGLAAKLKDERYEKKWLKLYKEIMEERRLRDEVICASA
jgi:hypothetical protein